KRHSLFYCHIKNIGDGLTFEPHLQGFPIISLSFTSLAWYMHIRQEIHLYQFHSCTFTCFAPSPFYVKRESSRFIASNFCFREIRKQASNISEDTSIGSWV